MSQLLKKQLLLIEKLIHSDLGKRGILHVKDNDHTLYKCVNHIFNDSQTIGVVSGFFVPQTETDGPLGALSICKTLSLLNKKKKVLLITDEPNRVVFEKGLQFYQLENKVPLVCFPSPKDDPTKEKSLLLSLDILKEQKLDHLICIERPGPSFDGICKNMRGLDISENVGFTDILFEEAKSRNVRITCIGDGGNEIGMGKLKDLVVGNIPNGDKIVSKHEADDVLVCGVSNWGGFAISCAMYLLQLEEHLKNCKSESNDKQLVEMTNFVPTIIQERALLEHIVKHGAVDGCTKESKIMVDGMYYDNEHKKILEEIISLTQEYTSTCKEKN